MISGSKLEVHGPIMKLLKQEYKVIHGFSSAVSILYRQQAAGGSAADVDLVESQYSGAKAELRKLYDEISNLVSEFGDDVEIAPKKLM